jgi:hypothetical protein
MPVPIDDFRIEKERLAVAVTTESGERLRGDLFVQRFARYRVGREEAADVLNAEEPYFPFALENDDTVLLAKARVRDVALPRTDGGGEPLLLRPATVELVLAGGAALLGEVLLDAPLARPRLLDFLNRVTQRFITLHTADGIRLVNSRLIERVRPLD